MEDAKPRTDTSISSIHDIKETSKRLTQFCCVAMIITSVTVFTNILHDNPLSVLLVVGLMSVLALMVWINIMGYARIAKTVLIVIINMFLVAIAFAEGLNTASIFYFLPLLYAIPFFIDNTKAYKLEVGIFFSFTLLCFISCIIFCGKTSTWQNISEAVTRQMFITNCVCSFLLCAFFAYLSVYLERKYATALLAQINKTEDAMDARTRFLSSMGHELRTPLNGIIGATNLLRSGRSLIEQKDYLDILKYCSDHMLGLVNDILDFNKIEAGQLDLHPVECNIHTLLKQSTLPFYNSFEEKKIDLQVVVDERLNQSVLIDDLRLVQVVNNLLSNALKFTENGYVRLQAYQQQRNSEQVTIHFSVKDSGIGIKKEDQQKIFVSFWQVYNQTTRKYEGTGLGLTICQRLLKMMNSSLLVESEEGKGSEFNFTITVAVIEAKKQKVVAPVKKSIDLEGIKILLVEDNIINTMIAKKILEDKKAILTTAQNGLEALLCLEADNKFAIILLDLEMPVMDGYTAIVEIRKKYPSIPVIAFTAALLDQQMLHELYELGFLDCIMKPFQPMDLFAKVRKYSHTIPLAYS
ncbi:MAG: response regulator [Segetibacter sp.]|nr:response regulator [Segetibacter sp.]